MPSFASASASALYNVSSPFNTPEQTFTKEYFYINGHCDTDFVLQHVSTTMAEAIEWTMTGEEVEDLIHYVGKNKQPQAAAAPAIEEPPREQVRIEEQPRKKRIHYDYDDWLEG